VTAAHTPACSPSTSPNRVRARSGYSYVMTSRPLQPTQLPHRLPEVEEISAGGVVIDVDNGVAQVAVIARRNRAGRVEWCLPKGHIEADETLEQTAVREVAEETGIIGRVLASLGTIDYWFSASGTRVHKIVHHYLLEATGGQLSIEGDPDAEAIDVAWFPLVEVQSHLTFPNERRIAHLAWERLAGAT
jgi:8-oxo-dGTP pyrophosphatase MutT (NUDIX family)